MIHSLRKHHRRLFVGLGFFLPVALAIGIAARRPVPEADSLPNELAPAPAQFESLESQRTDLLQNHRCRFIGCASIKAPENLPSSCQPMKISLSRI